jgi:hypothetical protein
MIPVYLLQNKFWRKLLIYCIDKCIDNNFTKTLLKAVFLLAFNAFLCLSEILVRSPKEVGSVIQKQDASFIFVHNHVVYKLNEEMRIYL